MVGPASQLIELQPLTVDQVSAAYVGWLNDPATNRYMGCARSVSTRESVAAFVDSFKGRDDRYLFGIFVRETGAHIGNVALQDIDLFDSRGEVGILIGAPEWRGRGVGTEAIRLIAEFAFSSLGLHRITAGVVAGNEGSRRAFEKAGFTLEGTLREHYVIDGVYHDVYRLGMLSGEFRGE